MIRKAPSKAPSARVAPSSRAGPSVRVAPSKNAPAAAKTEETKKEIKKDRKEVVFDYSLPNWEVRLSAEENDVICLPNNAIHLNEKFIDNVETDSGSDEDDLDLIDEEDSKRITTQEIANAMIRMGIDIDGRPLDWNSLFKDQNAAAAFTPLAVYGTPTETPCIVLFDYHSGFTCMDLTVIGGDLVYVCAEEHETMLLGRKDDKEWAEMGNPTGFLRLQQWSLVRRAVPRQSYSSLGLIPSSFIVSEKYFHENSALFEGRWFLGLCSFNDAFEYLLGDATAHQPGLFVIFSPRWLNIDPNEHRPYILLMLTRNNKDLITSLNDIATHVFQAQAENIYRYQNEMQVKIMKQLAEEEDDSHFFDEGDPEELAMRMQQEQEAQEKAKMVAETAKKGSSLPQNEQKNKKKEKEVISNSANTIMLNSKTTMTTQTKITPVASKMTQVFKTVNHENETTEKTEPPLNDFVEAATGTYSWQHYTIKRSFMGDYELFGSRYATLYHLVHDLSTRPSNLPSKLVCGALTLPPLFKVTPMEPPIRNPKRQPYSLPMQCEQWAANHYAQHTEPNFLNSPISYVIRTFLGPVKEYLGFSPTPAVKTKEKEYGYEPVNKKEEHMVTLDSSRVIIPPEDLIVDEKNQLGAGQFGKVFKAKMRDDRMGWVDVVGKSFELKEMNEGGRIPLFMELDICCSLYHPNVVTTYGMQMKGPNEPEAEGALAYLVLERCNDALEKWLMKRMNQNPLPNNQAIDFFCQIARGLGYLHTRVPAIAHGDVACRNVLMSDHPRDPERFVLKLCDFGLSKFVRSDSTTSYEDPSGKIPRGYLPPESANPGELSVATDCWSYGITIWELFQLTSQDKNPGGVFPWGVDGEPQVEKGFYHGVPHDIGHVPDFFYHLMMMCCRRAPHDRLSMAAADEYLQGHYIEGEASYIDELYVGRRS